MRRLFLASFLGLLLLAGVIGPITAPAAMPGDSRYAELTLTATGSDGAATGTVTGTYGLWGYIKAVHIDYGASVTNTTDITISTGALANTVMVKANSATDAWFYPAVQFTGGNGSAISGAYGRFPIDDYVVIQAAQSTSGTVAAVRIYYGQ
jgi:hypothetical protein